MDKKTGKELAQEVADFVNRFDTVETFNEFAEEIVNRTHRTLQQSTMRLFMTLVETWDELPEGRFDPRNEATVKLAKEIVKLQKEKDLYLPFI